MSALRRAIAPLWREMRLAYFEWALREIHPLHADVPHIVLHISRLQAQRQGGAS